MPTHTQKQTRCYQTNKYFEQGLVERSLDVPPDDLRHYFQQGAPSQALLPQSDALEGSRTQ